MLESVVGQDYRTLQIVVADDASTDGTHAIIREMAADDERIELEIGDENLGVTANCNRGLRRCTGKYVALASGDDRFLQGKIRAQVAWLEASSERVLCGHDVEILDEDTGRVAGYYSSLFPLRAGTGAEGIVRQGVPSPSPSAMVRRSAIPDHGYDERLRFASDWKLLIDCLLAGGVYGFVPGAYVRYRRHPESLGTRSANDLRMAHLALEDALICLGSVEANHLELARAAREHRGAAFGQFALTAMRLDEMAVARSAAMRAFRETPLSSAALGVFVALPQRPRNALRALGGGLFRARRRWRDRTRKPGAG
jgi:glycosyltransferase involved in cell wall biosynthesis